MTFRSRTIDAAGVAASTTDRTDTLPAGAKPLFEQVADALREQLDKGSPAPGERAPSLRAQARRLNVSIATAIRAYEQLEREGRLEARPRSGYFVAGRPAAPLVRSARIRTAPRPRPARTGEHFDEVIESARAPGVLPFALTNLSPSLLPAKALTRALRAVSAASPADLLQYSLPAGEPVLREQIAARESRLGAPVDPEHVIVTTGATEALAVALGALTRPGDTVVIESPAYFGILRLLEGLGLRVVPIETDPVLGLEPDALERVLRRDTVAAVVSIGTFNNPLGSLVPDEARQAIVALIARHRTWLVEDDIYADLHVGSVRPLPYRSFDRTGRVISCSSFSKTLAPGFRTGWVISSARREKLLRGKLIASGSSSRPTQLALARFLAEGGHERHLVRLRRSIQGQLGALRMAVHRHFPSGTRTSDPAGGFALWVQLPGGIDSRALYRLAIEEGISLAPGPLFSTARRHVGCLRLSAGEPWTDGHERAIARLGELTANLPS